MSGVLAGRTALVTGSSRGIGRAIAQRLASEGATVVVTARGTAPSVSIREGKATTVPGSLEETVELIEAAGGKALTIPADLEDAEALDTLVDRVVEEAGGIDILVNNAGFADYASIEKMSLRRSIARWRTIFVFRSCCRKRRFRICVSGEAAGSSISAPRRA